jgi:hypothetical protein
MTVNRLVKRLALLASLAAPLLGCSGINASKSVSPASFFLPGLMQNTPASESPVDPSTNLLSVLSVVTGPTLAQAR